LNPAFGIAEVFWILGGRSDSKFLSYFNRSFTRHVGTALHLHGAYGHRLRRHFNVDQLLHAYDTLRANPNSRQVVLQIWDAGADLPDTGGEPRDSDIPCNTQSILKVRDSKLEWLQVIRSNDVFLGLPHNLIQFTMIQEILAGWLGIEPGHYHQVSDSLHLYDGDPVSIQQPPAKVSAKSDIFALPKDESTSVNERMIEYIERIIDERHTAAEIAGLVGAVSLPDAYRNALCVMVAEGLRRRKDILRAKTVMSECSSVTFSRMWLNWCERLRVPSE
jgi:thymidylate synthase